MDFDYDRRDGSPENHGMKHGTEDGLKEPIYQQPPGCSAANGI